MNALDLLHYIAVRTVDPDKVGIPKVRADDAQFDRAIAGAFVMAGAVCVIFVIVGGIRFIMSEGEPGKITQARNTIIYALVGLAVVALSYILVRFIIEIARG